jgi:hypothetical protein
MIIEFWATGMVSGDLDVSRIEEAEGLPLVEVRSGVHGNMPSSKTAIVNAATVAEAVEATLAIVAGQSSSAVDDVALTLTFGYQAQCSIELSQADLDAIASLGRGVAITCYEVDPNET